MTRRYITCVLLLLAGFLTFASTNSFPVEQNEHQTVFDDAGLTSQVRARLAHDDTLSARNIDVETQEGIVSLRGTVHTREEADHAFELAGAVQGVRSVRSYLTVDESVVSNVKKDLKKAGDKVDDTSEEIGRKAEDAGEDVKKGIEKVGKEAKEGAEKVTAKAKDASITAGVKMKLAEDSTVKASRIDVDTKDRVVTLNGTVSSKAEEVRAIHLARSVKGVRMVRSNLVIHKESNS